MQHYSHLREAPRWGESENARARVQLRQVGDQLRQADLRHQQQRRSSWTAPVKFGKDTIKPIEEKSYQHLLFAQEQEARNKKFEEDVHFESKQVRSPTGTHSPLKVWIPPLKTERIKADGLPSALAGVDVGSRQYPQPDSMLVDFISVMTQIKVITVSLLPELEYKVRSRSRADVCGWPRP